MDLSPWEENHGERHLRCARKTAFGHMRGGREGIFEKPERFSLMIKNHVSGNRRREGSRSEKTFSQRYWRKLSKCLKEGVQVVIGRSGLRRKVNVQCMRTKKEHFVDGSGSVKTPWGGKKKGSRFLLVMTRREASGGEESHIWCKRRGHGRG